LEPNNGAPINGKKSTGCERESESSGQKNGRMSQGWDSGLNAITWKDFGWVRTCSKQTPLKKNKSGITGTGAAHSFPQRQVPLAG